MVLMSKLSKIEGRKESLTGQHNLTAKLYQRGDINEEAFIEQSEKFQIELETLENMKQSALDHYAAA